MPKADLETTRAVFAALGEAIHRTAREKKFWRDPKSIDELLVGLRGSFATGGLTAQQLRDLVEEARETMPRAESELIALEHSELSEALEAVRHGNPPSTKIPAFSLVEEELADALIRILDHGHAKGYDLAGAVFAKMAYNETRPIKHGGKAF